MNDRSKNLLVDRRPPAWIGYLAVVVLEAALTAFLFAIEPYLPLHRYPIPYILMIMLVAYFWGAGPAALAFFAGLLAFDYYFVPPYRTLIPHVAGPDGWAGIVAYLLGALIVATAMIMIRSSMRRTERIAGELRESRGDLKHAQAVAHIGSWRLDVRRNQLLWSDEVYRMFGLPIGAPLTYESFLNSVHPDDREYVDGNWNAALGGKTYDIEHRITVGEAVKWVHERAELEFDSEGGLLGGFGTVQDITEQKKAEEAVAISGRKLAEIIESISEGFWALDREWNYVYINRRQAEAVGMRPEDLIGRNVWATFPKLRGTVAEENYRAAMEKREPRRFETSGVYPGKHFDVRVYPSEEGISVLSSDITDRRKAEEALREEQEHKLDFYRRTIEAATEGKLIICDWPEIERAAGPMVATWAIRTPADIGVVRHGVQDAARSAGIDESRVGKLAVAVGEAVTNSVKHAPEGAASLHRNDGSLMLLVSDCGPGIPALALPDVALRPGYSTAGTLGMGYKMMIRFADKVYLATGPEGTTVGIEMGIHPAEKLASPL